jgi:hypothetical protein
VSREGGMIGFSGTGTAAIGLELLGPRQETLGIMWADNYVNVWEGMALAGVPQSPSQTNTESFDRLPNGETVRRRFEVQYVCARSDGTRRFRSGLRGAGAARSRREEPKTRAPRHGLTTSASRSARNKLVCCLYAEAMIDHFLEGFRGL